MLAPGRHVRWGRNLTLDAQDTRKASLPVAGQDVLTADNISEAVVPMLVAGIRDRTGSYGQGFTVLVILAALGAVAVSLLPKKKPDGQ